MCFLQLVEGAEAKALYGLTLNYKPLEALVDRLLRDTTLSGDQVAEVLNGAGLIPFPDPFVEGFKWDDNGRLIYPGMPDEVIYVAMYTLLYSHTCNCTNWMSGCLHILVQSVFLTCP